MQMDQKVRKHIIPSSVVDIDQLCHLIDENTFGLKISSSSSKLPSIPSYQVKAFGSSRLKRLNSSSPSTTKSNSNDNYSTLLTRFRSLSTDHLPQSTHSSTTECSAKTILPSLNEEEMNISIQSPSSSSSSAHSRRISANSCNVEELAAYFDHFLYLPKSLSGAAELMYT